MFFTVEKISKQLAEIRGAIYRAEIPVPRFKWFEGECPGAERPEFDDRQWDDFKVGGFWGGYDIVAWFRAHVPIPPEMRQHELALHLIVGPRDGGESTAETLVYVNGIPLQGLDMWHEEVWLPPELLQQNEITVALKAWSGVLGVPDKRRFKLARLVAIDQDAECLYYLADTVLKAVLVLDENDLRRTRLLQALDEAFRHVDWTQPGSPQFYVSLALAGGLLTERVDRLNAAGEIRPRVIGIGHSHLDMAWLWRLKHTREKAARTFSTALHLMRQYPEYHFLHTSPQLFQFLKQDYPVLYDQIREKIASGKWEISGGMWVEADTNLTGGESLIRQILFGKRFTRQEFGLETRVLWMPDVFGFSAALPQLLRQSGIDYFMTTKISWNQFNRFPYDTFRWRGLDGTEVLAHFITTPSPGSTSYTYNGEITPFAVKGIWDEYKQQDLNEELLLCFGAGDGGGGPTKEMLEAARVMQNLSGLPELKLGRAEDFFERLGARTVGRELPVWDGELYLEYHRGTYTSQAANKRANRASESLYHDAEWLSTLSDVLLRERNYPIAELTEGWEKILLNQFHDILPGSSIHAVYEDSQQDYARIREIGDRAVERAGKSIAARIPAGQASIVVFNSLGWKRDALVEMPWSEEMADKAALDETGTPSPSQTVEEHGMKKVLFLAKGVPGLGYRTVQLVEDFGSLEERIHITPTRLENRYYRIELNERGQLVSLFDKINARQVLASGARGNVFQVFEDKPMAFDAWDIDIYYQEKMKEIDNLVEAVVEEVGPLRGVLRLRWKFCDSVITQRIALYQHSPRIDFRTEVDWQEKQVLLKTAFPVDVRSTRATYDIQFGNVERPTHWNTSWDYARFEVVGHKWADLSEGNYGVALLNDCKYGYDIKKNVMRLTLIKSPVEPDALADKGHHEFTYSLLPHAGGWQTSPVIPEAYALNYGVRARPIPGPQEGNLPCEYAFASVDADGVIIETVKKAEEQDAWIVRLYETKQNRHAAVKMTFGETIQQAVECDVLEREIGPVQFSDHQLLFSIAPYQIKTFKIQAQR